MFALLFRGLLFISVVATYTFSVWNMISKHFIEEFNKHLTTQRDVTNTPNIEQGGEVCVKADVFAMVLHDYLHFNECRMWQYSKVD